MNSPPIYQKAKASAEVVALLGNEPRVYLFGEAAQGVQDPYAVWQTVSGTAENYLDSSPNIDRMTTQIDVYGKTANQVRSVAEALRNALEFSSSNIDGGYVVAWRGESRDPATRRYRYSFDIEWILYR